MEERPQHLLMVPQLVRSVAVVTALVSLTLSSNIGILRLMCQMYQLQPDVTRLGSLIQPLKSEPLGLDPRHLDAKPCL